jgi:hypothetical protein
MKAAAVKLGFLPPEPQSNPVTEAEGIPSAPPGMPEQISSPASPQANPIQDYLAAEQEGAAEQEKNESGYYRQRMQESMTQMQGTQQQLDAAQQQMQTLQQAAADAQPQIAAATQQAVAAQDEATRQTQMSSNMRIGYQKLRSQLMEVASQDPEMVANPMAPDPALGGDPAMGQGPVGQAASPGTPPGSPGAGAGGSGPQAPAQPVAPSGQAQATAVPQTQAKTAGAKDTILKALPAVAGGALGGAALGAIGAANKGDQVSDLQAKIKEITSRGEGGYGQASELARAKANLGQAEVASKYPGEVALRGGLIGAGTGAFLGPSVANAARAGGGLVKEMFT